jgi:mono/diheme cytochrome c family protein
MRRPALVCAALALTVSLWAGVGDGKWLSRVPQKAASRPNPTAGDPQAEQVGAKLFAKHCESCHGESGEGRDGKPSLHSDNVAQATPGQLFWLVTNGSLKNGMPSWSRLPEQQRWQIVTHVKTLVNH